MNTIHYGELNYNQKTKCYLEDLNHVIVLGGQSGAVVGAASRVDEYHAGSRFPHEHERASIPDYCLRIGFP
jgi:hypothetical protein